MKLHSVAKSLVSGTLLPLLVLPLGAQTARKNTPTDSEILGQVQKTFHDEHAFVGSSILPSVNHGVVTLTGNVRSEAEKTLASAELASIDGVKTVLNNLNIVDNTFHAPPPKPIAGPSGPKLVTLPAGSAIPVRVTDEIDTKTAKAGDTFHGATATSVTMNGFTLIPPGTPVTGRVIEAKAAGHFSGSADLAIELVSVRLHGPNGPQDVSLLTQPLSNKAQGRGTNTAEKTGGGAALGAIIGGLAGGGAGAEIGALSGGVLGGGSNALSRGKEIVVKPEQLLAFRTSSPLEVTIVLVDGHQIVPADASGPQLQGRPVSSIQTQ
jgi:hypothetical protein